MGEQQFKGERSSDCPDTIEPGIDLPRLEASLSEMYERASRVHELGGSAPLILFTTDAELRYTWVHHANPDFLCCDPLGKRDLELLQDRGEAHCLEELKREVLRTGQPVRTNVHVTSRKSRYYFDLSLQRESDSSGNVIGLVGFAVDVTEQVERERERRSAEKTLLEESCRRDERQRLVAQATNDVIWDLDLRSSMLEWSDATTQVLGFGPDELRTQKDRIERIHPDDRERVVAGANGAAAGNAKTWSAEYRFQRKDGRYIVILDRSMIARDEFGKAYRMVGSMLDLTERRNFEDELERAKTEAEAANDAKEWFLAVLSHELRTPLTPVLTAAQLLAEETLTPEQVHELARIIRRNVELETRLMDDLLDHTRIRRGKLQLRMAQTDVHEAISQALEIVQPDAKLRGITLGLKLNAPQTRVLADPARLQQVLWNLLKNAIKFTPAQGAIEIRTASAGDGMIEISVSDNGLGIDSDDLSSIFEPFKQGRGREERQSGGLGLGLALTKGLVELHGGTIQASSDGMGKGATLAFVIPALAGDVVPEPERLDATVPDVVGQRILLVEDDADTARLMARILKQRGHEVRIADSVASALRQAAANEFDVLLSDIGLPDGSGLDLMRQLQLERPIQGIVMSGYGMEDDLRRSREAGFHAHLTKPVTVQQISAALAELARKAQ